MHLSCTQLTWVRKKEREKERVKLHISPVDCVQNSKFHGLLDFPECLRGQVSCKESQKSRFSYRTDSHVSVGKAGGGLEFLAQASAK